MEKVELTTGIICTHYKKDHVQKFTVDGGNPIYDQPLNTKEEAFTLKNLLYNLNILWRCIN